MLEWQSYQVGSEVALLLIICMTLDELLSLVFNGEKIVPLYVGIKGVRTGKAFCIMPSYYYSYQN